MAYMHIRDSAGGLSTVAIKFDWSVTQLWWKKLNICVLHFCLLDSVMNVNPFPWIWKDVERYILIDVM